MWSDSNRRDLWSARPCAPARTGKRKQTTKRLRPATFNPELACLKALFNYAIKSDLPLTNPVSRVKFLKEQNERTRVLSYDEQGAVSGGGDSGAPPCRSPDARNRDAPRKGCLATNCILAKLFMILEARVGIGRLAMLQRNNLLIYQ